MVKEKNIRYRGRGIVVLFNPDRCIHVAECLRGLPEVFDNSRNPWINPDAAPPDAVAEVIRLCPTGSLHYFRTDGGPEEEPPSTNRIVIADYGPYYVLADVEIATTDGALLFKDKRIGLCRCGASKHMPICDGRHFEVDFMDQGTLPEELESQSAQEGAPRLLRITSVPNGPLLVSGSFIMEGEGSDRSIKLNRASLCRCGASKSKPFCDGGHVKADFKAV